LNILVVDDEPVIVLGIIKQIRSMRDVASEVVGANSACEALTVMEEFIPDLLITDVQMPFMTGLELIKQTRENGWCHNFIVLSAYEEFEYAKTALQYHVIDYLVKPVNWDILESHIREFAMQPKREKVVASAYTDYETLLPTFETEQCSPFLKKLTTFINSHYNTLEICLNSLSDFSGMSENYICNVFKKELNTTFLEYLVTMRLRQAIRLLLTQREMNVKEISLAVGYRSERQFFRQFRNHLETTPQQFREKYL
jgi:YesN/AraC family two-component response regulator